MGVMRHNLIFDGINAAEKGIVIYGGTVDEIAERDVETVDVPGRNGVLHLDNGRWGEREQRYLAFINGDNYAARLSFARLAFGRVGKGYKRLEDTYNADVYSMASFIDAMAPESMAFRTAGLVELAFSCRPERFLRTGEQSITAAPSVVLANPSGMPARPLLTVYGTGAGVLNVGNTLVYIDSITDYITIDCDTQDAYRGTVNCNGDIRLGSFPVLGDGLTGVSVSGDLTSVSIIPRWWRL